jgi:uncharacterized Zn-binding protein involved in type VI secretion
MAGIARATIDFSSTHSNDETHLSPAQTKYVPNGAKVFINGYPAVRLGDSTECGDTVNEASAKVFIGGKGVHRLGDSLSAHGGTYTPSVCISASGNVSAG